MYIIQKKKQKKKIDEQIAKRKNITLIKKDINHPKNRRINITVLSYIKELNVTETKDYFE